jgi:hypothetical protein
LVVVVGSAAPPDASPFLGGFSMTRTTREALRPRRLLPLFRREGGQATFEFLLILPFFIIFLLLLIDFGMMMYEYVSVSNAVREGARYGAVNCGDGACTLAEVKARVIERSGGILSNTDPPTKVEVFWNDNSIPADGKNYGRGDSVVVKVDHDYEFLFFPWATIPVVSCADMRLEQTDDTTSLPSGSGCG